MRRGGASALVFLAAAAGGWAQIRVLSTTVTPARPYVGDAVECSVSFEAPDLQHAEGPLEVPPPSGGGAETELASASIRKKGSAWVYTVRFTAWVPGQLRLPVPPSAGFILPEVRVEIASAVDDFGRSPPAYKDPLELPGTRFLVWGVSGGLLLGAVLAWSTAFGLIPWIRRLRKAWREGRAGRDFGRALDGLEALAGELMPEESWALLAKALREYLEARTRVPYRSLTAKEAKASFPEGLPEGVAGEAAALLAEGDAVRFARAGVAAGALDRAVEKSRDILRSVEEAARDLLR